MKTMRHALTRSPVVHGPRATWYAKNYLAIEEDATEIFDHIDTPLLDTMIKPGMHVLDATMGQGRHAIRYAKRKAFVWANDINPAMVRIARAAARSAKIPENAIKFSMLDVCSLRGIPPASFDIVHSMFSSIGTIPGSERRQRAITAMAKTVRPNGLVVIHAHNRLDSFFKPDFMPWAYGTLFNPGKGMECGDIITDYNGLRGMFNHFYTPGEFRKSFQSAGLKVIEEHYYAYQERAEIHGPLKKLKADGFIFVGRRVQKTKLT